MLSVRVTGESATQITLASCSPGARINSRELVIPLPAVEVGIPHGLPQLGSETSQIKVLEERVMGRALHLQLSAPAGSVQFLALRRNDPRVRLQVDGAELSPDSTALLVRFPSGTGYIQKEVSLSW